jgi:GH15 family glucan-1,4-alpha-glucosidase
MNAGYYDDARVWRDWLLRAVAGRPEQIQIMYGLTGEHRLPEWEVSWLDGFQNSKPVRVGNAAHRQLQLDVYGEVMDALHHGRKGKLAPDEAGWELQKKLLEHLETIWKEPDHGIWEVRRGKKQFTSSKVMAWVAFDRAVKSVEQFQMKGPVDRWRVIRNAIHDEVCRCGFDKTIGAFVQSYGSKQIDASALLIPLVGFLGPNDPRIRSTVEVVKKDLMVEGLVRRYHTDTAIDGLPPGEGVFLPCSFWLADNLVLLGRQDEAKQLFERLLSLRNDLGLLSEEYDVHSDRQLGNFPQALSHIALINSAYLLASTSKFKRHEAESSLR